MKINDLTGIMLSELVCKVLWVMCRCFYFITDMSCMIKIKKTRLISEFNNKSLYISALVLYKFDFSVSSPDPANLKSTPPRYYMELNHIFTEGVGVMNSLSL